MPRNFRLLNEERDPEIVATWWLKRNGDVISLYACATENGLLGSGDQEVLRISAHGASELLPITCPILAKALDCHEGEDGHLRLFPA